VAINRDLLLLPQEGTALRQIRPSQSAPQAKTNCSPLTYNINLIHNPVYLNQWSSTYAKLLRSGRFYALWGRFLQVETTVADALWSVHIL